MFKTKEYISGKLYSELFALGGDSLVAFYCILRKSRKESGDSNFYSYTSKKGRVVSGANLIRNKTNLTLSVIKNNLPLLVESGVTKITSNGHVILEGVNKTNKKLYGSDYVKHIPIEVSTFKLTKLYSYFIRIHSLERVQRRTYKRKQDRKEQLKHIESGFIPQGMYKRCINTYKKHLKDPSIVSGTLEKAVLSLQGFAKYKDDSSDNKSKGAYWKRKLVSNELLTVKRRYEEVKCLRFNRRVKNERFRPASSSVKNMLLNTFNQEGLKGRVFYSPKHDKFFRELMSEFSTTSNYNSICL